MVRVEALAICAVVAASTHRQHGAHEDLHTLACCEQICLQRCVESPQYHASGECLPHQSTQGTGCCWQLGVGM